jgi:hypothetical protein
LFQIVLLSLYEAKESIATVIDIGISAENFAYFNVTYISFNDMTANVIVLLPLKEAKTSKAIVAVLDVSAENFANVK